MYVRTNQSFAFVNFRSEQVKLFLELELDTTQALSEHQVSEKKRKATEILILTEKINMVRDNCDTF